MKRGRKGWRRGSEKCGRHKKERKCDKDGEIETEGGVEGNGRGNERIREGYIVREIKSVHVCMCMCACVHKEREVALCRDLYHLLPLDMQVNNGGNETQVGAYMNK